MPTDEHWNSTFVLRPPLPLATPAGLLVIRSFQHFEKLPHVALNNKIRMTPPLKEISALAAAEKVSLHILFVEIFEIFQYSTVTPRLCERACEGPTLKFYKRLQSILWRGQTYTNTAANFNARVEVIRCCRRGEVTTPIAKVDFCYFLSVPVKKE